MPTVQLSPKKSLRGSALMMAIFIMVVLMLLGTALMKTLSSSSEAIAQEVIGTRALAAANSGMQAHLYQLFPLGITDAGCPSDHNYEFNNTPGLYQCKASVSCAKYATDDDGINYYRLTSAGSCGSGVIDTNSDGIVVSSRTVRVEAREL
ncbi:type II secretory pathway protein [Colwelliaceae bacterium 6471]